LNTLLKSSRSIQSVAMSSQYPEDDEDEEHDQNIQSDTRKVASKGEERLAARSLPGAEALPPQESVNGEAQCTGSNGPSSISSLPYGGARPKTRMVDVRNRRGEEEVKRGAADAEALRGAELRSRLSECEVNVQSCDTYEERDESAEGRMKERGAGTFGRIESRGELRGVNRNDRVGCWSSLPDDTEGGEDEFCIYTYKGGTAYLTADLPNSFFRLDSGSDGESLPGVAGAGQSNLSTGVAALIQDQLINAPPPVRSFSPSEDFIEMDFDPGSDVESESSGDSGQGRDGTDMEGDEREEREESSDEEPSPPPVIALPPALVLVEPPFMNNNTLQSKPEAACTSCEEALAPAVPSTSSNALLDLREPALGPAPQTSSAPALSPAEEVPVLLPRSKSLNSSLASCLIFSSEPPTRTANLSLCGSRLLQREARLFGEGELSNDSKAVDSVEEDAAMVRIVDSLPSLRLGQKAMIWTEKEALRKQVIQLGTSACGATALVNVLQALEVDFPLPLLLEAVDTRLRRPDSSLPDYLLSRSRAGCNNRDLEAGAARVSPRIVTRFFPFHRRSVAVAAWLARWITAGCVPILTLNVQRAVQRPGESPADAWHHQMVWGVADREVYLANPLEMVQERELLPQLDSPSELLVRRSDVVSRCGPETDLLELRDFGEQWRSLNVLGQVVNVLREEKREAREEGGRTLTSHVKIPADYTAGALLCCLEENTEAVRLLKEAPDLQLKK